jgi:hypothetical protein
MSNSQKRPKSFINLFIVIELELEINKLCVGTRTKNHNGQSQQHVEEHDPKGLVRVVFRLALYGKFFVSGEPFQDQQYHNRQDGIPGKR